MSAEDDPATALDALREANERLRRRIDELEVDARAHQRTEQRYRMTIERAPIGVAERSFDGRWLSVNDRLCEITGYTREELLTLSFDEITHTDDLVREEELNEALRDRRRERYQLEKRYIRKDGVPVWVNITASVLEGHGDTPARCIAVVEDISLRRRAEERLRDSEARFRKVLEASPVPMMLYTEHGEILGLSRSFTELTGYTLADVPTLEHWYAVAYDPEQRALVERSIEEVWANGAARSYEVSVRTKDGGTKIFSFHAVTLGRDVNGTQARLSAAIDITLQRTFERDALEAARQKDEFMAMLGHELRNPVAAVLAATELLGQEERPDAPGITRIHDVLRRQTRHMAKLLDGLLEVSRVVRGKIELETRPLDLSLVVGDLLTDMTFVGSAAGVQEGAPPPPHAGVDREGPPSHRVGLAAGVTLDAQLPEAEVWVEGDPVRLTQVFGNLLSNAIKYTPAPGRITVRLSEEDGRARFEVTDTGDGIEPELLTHLFEPFRQGSQTYDRARGGLGLGLALADQLVALHDGTLRASSPGPGRGATFVVELPLTAPPTPTRSPSAPREGQLSILVIEDNEDAGELLQALLERRGHRVRVTTRGRDGLELARASVPDVVICDLGLPGMTGFEVAQAVRGDRLLSAIRMVAVSGYARAEDRARSLEAGFDAHLKKPASLDDLEAALRA